MGHAVVLIELRDGEAEMVAAGLVCRAATLVRLANRTPHRPGSRQLREWAARHMALAARVERERSLAGKRSQ